MMVVCARRLALGEAAAVGVDWVNSVLLGLVSVLCWTWTPLTILFWVNLSMRMPLTSGDAAQQARARALLVLLRRGAWGGVSQSTTPSS